jgi:hypothetical protein
MQIERSGELTAAEHGQGRLHVGSSRLQWGQLLRRGVGDVLTGTARRPWRMGADVGGQDLGDGGPVGGGVAGDALQCVDATQDDLELILGAELVDCAGKPFGKLPAAAKFELVPAGLKVVLELLAVVLELISA